jgi:hypothetical protein
VLYERWGSRPQFQLTRGTLRFLSHLLAHLWKSTDLAVGALIHPMDVDLADDAIRGEALRVAGSVWESIIGTDIAQWEGDTAISQRLDEKHGGLYRRLHQEQYGTERVNEQALTNAIQRCIREQRFGFAPTATASVGFDVKEFSLQSYLGQPTVVPPGARVIRFEGAVTPIELASVLQTATALSRLGQSQLHLVLKLELTGEINNHAVTVSLTQLRQRVQALRVEDSEQ